MIITTFSFFSYPLVSTVSYRVQGRNPQTGEVITIPATKRIRFKPYGNITNLSMKYGI